MFTFIVQAILSTIIITNLTISDSVIQSSDSVSRYTWCRKVGGASGQFARECLQAQPTDHAHYARHGKSLPDLLERS